jgi:CubicO group peptidase (beta-lactamase class C family)
MFTTNSERVRESCCVHIASAEQCYYEAYVRKYILEKLGTKLCGMRCTSRDNCPPAWNDPTYRKGIIQGVVSDENSFAMGGISGHAGLFCTALDTSLFLKSLMFDEVLWNKTTMKLFTTVDNATFSSRALGWDTLSELPASCATLSPRTYMHTG